MSYLVLTWVDWVVHPDTAAHVLVEEGVGGTREDAVALETGVYPEVTRILVSHQQTTLWKDKEKVQ